MQGIYVLYEIDFGQSIHVHDIARVVENMVEASHVPYRRCLRWSDDSGMRWHMLHGLGEAENEMADPDCDMLYVTEGYAGIPPVAGDVVDAGLDGG